MIVLLLASACSRQEEKPKPTAVAPAPSASPPMLALTPLPTTAPTIALGNLDGEIADREKRSRGGDAVADIELVPRYLTRAQFAGRIGDLAWADEASNRALKALPYDGKAHLARAQALSAMHEFAAALAELDAALSFGAPPDAVTAARASTLIGMGREDDARALLSPDDKFTSTLVVRGALASLLGDAKESETLFELARTSYRDVSPFAVAWMDFERARALERAGDLPAAHAYFAEAAAVMPTYTHAVVHLAAYETPACAIELLEPLAKTTADPDVDAARAEALRLAGREDESVMAAGRGRQQFEALLGRFPKAFADHAATFLLGAGKGPKRALDLAKANAANRPTAEAVELWLVAAQAAKSKDEGCAAAAKARALPHAPAALKKRADVICR